MSRGQDSESSSDAAPKSDAASRPIAPSYRASPLRTALLSLCVAVAAAVIVTARFAPRFALWAGLAVAGDMPVPTAEFDRAVPSLAQLDNPWAPVDHPFHMVIAWRLLFPVVGHYLHLSHGVYLALPHVGCLLVLWLVAALTYRRLNHWCMTFVATTIFAALPWFFVSSSWLTHFDSWLILGLLVAAFIPSRVALGAACLLTPWVDERFVLCLPATVAIRAIALGQIQRGAWRELFGDLAVVALTSAPYPVIRAISWLHGDANSTKYVRNHWSELPTVPWLRFLEGMWSGYRLAWLVIVAGLVVAVQRMPRRFGVPLVLVEIGTAVCGLFIAWDMSRSMMMITPLLVFSMWLWEEWRTSSSPLPETGDDEPSNQSEPPTGDVPRASRSMLLAWFLPVVLAANLYVPAYHMLWSNDWPVKTFYTEFDNWRHPPNLFRAVEYLHEARRLKESGHPQEALAKLDEALRCEGNYSLALVERAMLRMQLGMLDGAEADASEALRLLPDYPFAFLLRGALRNERGDKAGAAEDFRHALAIAPADWEFRQQTMQRLSEITP